MTEPIKIKGMGVLTGLSAVSTLLQAGEYAKLQALEEQGQRQEFEKLFRSYLRDAIFRIKSDADDAIGEMTTNPKYSATVLKILSAKLAGSLIKPENFDDLADKTYASDTIKLISKNDADISSQLSGPDSLNVQEALKQYASWSDLKYYLDSRDALQAYRNAESRSKNRAGTLVSGLFVAAALIVSLFAFRAMARMEIGLPCLAFVMLIIGLIGLLVVNSGKKKAKKDIEEFKSLYDADKLLSIDHTNNSSVDAVKAKMMEIEQTIIRLVGKMPALT